MNVRSLFCVLVIASTGLVTAAAFAEEPVHGVTDTEIIIGTVTDLSGVTAIQGVNNANAIRMLFDEANAKGGVNGRKIRYIVEDSQYQVPRAVQAMNKLLNNEGVHDLAGRWHPYEQRYMADGDRKGHTEAPPVDCGSFHV